MKGNSPRGYGAANLISMEGENKLTLKVLRLVVQRKTIFLRAGITMRCVMHLKVMVMINPEVIPKRNCIFHFEELINYPVFTLVVLTE